MPLSSTISISPPTACAIAGSVRIEAGWPSRLLPPWFETEIAVAPMSTARRASSGRAIPLIITDPSHAETSQRRSSQVGGGVSIHSP